MSENGTRRAVIISLPGALQESMRAMIDAMPGVEVVGIASGGLSALALIQQVKPDVAIIDSNLSEDEVLALLNDVRKADGDIHLVVLTLTSRQQRRVLQGGAGVVLSRWSPAHEFMSAVLGNR